MVLLFGGCIFVVGTGKKKLFTVLKIFLNIYLLCLCVHLPGFLHGDERTTSSTVWDLEIDLRMSGSAESTLITEPHPWPQMFILFKGLSS